MTFYQHLAEIKRCQEYDKWRRQRELDLAYEEQKRREMLEAAYEARRREMEKVYWD